MAEKNRIRNLSTRWLLPFKIIVFAIYTCLCVGIAYTFLDDAHNIVDWLMGLMMAASYCYIFYRLMLVTAKLHRIEFDQSYLYVLLRKQDMVIPLENIKSVEILTLGGVYKVTLYAAEQLGDVFYFKLSLWYPLNYQSKDALVNLFRFSIDKAKSKKQEFPINALRS
jgi:hypothetical protein